MQAVLYGVQKCYVSLVRGAADVPKNKVVRTGLVDAVGARCAEMGKLRFVLVVLGVC